MFKPFFTARNFEGQVFPELIGSVDHCTFDITNGYCVFAVLFDHPTTIEVQNFCGAPKDFGLSVFEDVMYFTLKVGSLDWNEAPFSPHLSVQANVLEAIDTYTKELEIMLIDSSDGRVKYCETFPLDAIMSAAIKASIIDAFHNEFDRSVHFEHIQQIQSMMDTSQIAQLASARQIFE